MTRVQQILEQLQELTFKKRDVAHLGRRRMRLFQDTVCREVATVLGVEEGIGTVLDVIKEYTRDGAFYTLMFLAITHFGTFQVPDKADETYGYEDKGIYEQDDLRIVLRGNLKLGKHLYVTIEYKGELVVDTANDFIHSSVGLQWFSTAEWFSPLIQLLAKSVEKSLEIRLQAEQEELRVLQENIGVSDAMLAEQFFQQL